MDRLRFSTDNPLKAKARGGVFRKNQLTTQAHPRSDWQSLFALTPEAPENLLEPSCETATNTTSILI